MTDFFAHHPLETAAQDAVVSGTQKRRIVMQLSFLKNYWHRNWSTGWKKRSVTKRSGKVRRWKRAEIGGEESKESADEKRDFEQDDMEEEGMNWVEQAIQVIKSIGGASGEMYFS